MLDQSGITQSGTLTFKADMTFLHVVTTHGTTKETAPTSCLAQLNQSSCEEWASNMGSLPEATHTCTTEGSVCKCTSVILEPPEPYEARGFFSTDGATITYPADAGPFHEKYCVQGDTLHLLNVDQTTDQVLGELVATRQAPTDGGLD